MSKGDRQLDKSTIDQSDRPTYIHSHIHTDIIPIPTYRLTDVSTYRRTDVQKTDHEQGPFAFELRNSHALTKRGKGKGPKVLQPAWSLHSSRGRIHRPRVDGYGYFTLLLYTLLTLLYPALALPYPLAHSLTLTYTLTHSHTHTLSLFLPLSLPLPLSPPLSVTHSL